MRTDKIGQPPAEERYATKLALEPGRLIREIDEPIWVGNILWVFTDPHRGHELAYNRWYERDHFYGGCMVGASNFAGSRWVATRRHKQARLVGDADWPFPSTDGSYACVYYVWGAHFEEWLPWASTEVGRLYEANRGFQARTHYNTAIYDYEWRAYREPDPVPLELAIEHRYPGLVAQFVSARDDDFDELDQWFDEMLPSWLEGSPVANVSSWKIHDNPAPAVRTDPGPRPPGDPSTPHIPGDTQAIRRRLQLYFLESDPLLSWDHHHDLASRLEDSGVGRVDIALPFIATVPGTDRYVDELW